VQNSREKEEVGVDSAKEREKKEVGRRKVMFRAALLLRRGGVGSRSGASRAQSGAAGAAAPAAAAAAAAAADASAAAARLHAPTRTGHRVSVIMRETLDALGVAGEEVTVAPGYARNFLVPQRKAVYATAKTRAAFRVELSAAAAAEAAAARAARLLLARVASIELVFKRASADGARLYGGVTAADVATALAATPLRSLGVTDARVRFAQAAKSLDTVGKHVIEVEPRAAPGLWCALKVLVSAT